ncbi:MAG: MFS transporter [Dehalococcoidia bacterium]|jgi:MFS family permease|nr:MFS transporter [Dehalococcoidia bacterium]
MTDRPEAGSGARAGCGIFYGWWIVAAGSILNALGGGTYWMGFSVYFLPVTKALELSRAQTSFAYGLGRLEGGLEGPLAGYLVDRLGPRTMIAFGGLLAGTGFILLSLTHSFSTFLLVYVGVLAMGMNAGFNHGIMAAVNQWFVRRKGLAMSFATMGISIGGAVVTPAVAFLVLTMGWRTGAMISGIVLIAAVMPLSLVFRRSPETMGLLPDGDRVPPIAAVSPLGTSSERFERHVTAVDFTTKEALKTPTYWLLALAMGLRIAAHTGVFVHLVPLMVWRGQSEATGAFVVAFTAFTTIPLRVGLGWVGDKWAKQKVCALTMLLGTVSLVVLLASGGALWQLLIFAALFAFAEGVSGVSWSLIGDYFGRKSFATLRGGVTTVHSILSMGVPVFAGWVYDTSGSYYWALIPIVVLYLLAAAMFWNLPKARLPRRLTDPSADAFAAPEITLS